MYIAPEVITHKCGGYSFPADLWSAGVIMFCLLGGTRKPCLVVNRTILYRVECHGQAIPPSMDQRTTPLWRVWPQARWTMPWQVMSAGTSCRTKPRTCFTSCWTRTRPHGAVCLRCCCPRFPLTRACVVGSITAAQALEHPWIVSGGPEHSTPLLQAVDSLKNFHTQHGLKKAVLQRMASQLDDGTLRKLHVRARPLS